MKSVDQLALAGGAGGELGLQVAHHLVGQAYVGRHHVPDALHGLAGLDELHIGDAQALLVDLVRGERVGAGDDAANVGMVGERAGPARQPVLEVDRLDDVDVGQVHAAGDVGIVEDVDVARRHAAVEVAHEAGHGVVEGAQMHGRGQPLRQRLAAVVEDGRGEVHGVADDAGIGRAHEVERHVVGDGVEAALEDLEQEGIDVAAHGAAQCVTTARSIRMLPSASRRPWRRAGRRRCLRIPRSRAGPGAASRRAGTWP